LNNGTFNLGKNLDSCQVWLRASLTGNPAQFVGNCDLRNTRANLHPDRFVYNAGEGCEKYEEHFQQLFGSNEV